jgi:hypothetical protein
MLGLCGLGAAWLMCNAKYDVAGFCLGPIALTVAAAFVHQYPLSGSRLTLFLIPGLLLLAASGAAMVQQGLARHRFEPLRYAWLPAAAPLLIMGISQQGYRLAHPRYRSHIRPAVEYVRAHRQPGDAIYLAGAGTLPAANGSKERHIEFLCYWRHPDPPFYLEWCPAADIPHRRFWLVFPFRPKQGKRLTAALLKDAKTVADERAAFVTNLGGAAYLFEKR